MFSQELGIKTDGAAARCVAAAVVLAGLLLVPLVYYRDFAVPNSKSWRMLVKVHRLQGGASLSAGGGVPDAMAQQRFAAVLDSYLRRHRAALVLLDAPETRADPEAAAGLRLVVVEPGHEVRAAPDLLA